MLLRWVGTVVSAGALAAWSFGSPVLAEPAATAVANAEATAPLPATTSPRAVGAVIRERLLADAKTAKDEEAADWQALIAFYETRADEPLFVGRAGYTPKAVALIEEMKKSADYGLDPSDYVVLDMGADSSDRAELTPDQKVEGEQTFALTVLKYARHARGGRIPEPAKQLASYVDRTPQYVDPKKLLDDLAAASDPAEVLRGTHPKHAQFEKLRQRYLELKRSADQAKDVIRLPAKGAKLVPGQSHPDVALLRQRLGVPAGTNKEGETDDNYYDDTLAEAVAKFQNDKGQKPDGIVGPRTRKALNDIDVPSPERVLANMEMWRWMPDDLGDFHVWVNLPEFLVRVVKNGEIVHEERIIVGELNNQTPIFSDVLETIYFNPRWNVPQSIKVNELYPGLARGGGSFERQGLRMMRNGRYVDPYSIDWSRADIRNYDVYQPSGPGNALGIVKFTFPNKHAVYLHDTPTKNLFNEQSRTFSHGCMRVRNPMRLAEVLLEKDKGWSPDQVHETQQSDPDEVAVKLDTAIPVHITYFTELIGEDGSERVVKDVYGHEQRVKLALAGKFDQIAKGRDHLAPVKFSRVQYSGPDDWGFFYGPSSQNRRYKRNNSSLNDFFNNMFGGGF
ncbi:MAG: L,D-transpeptidase family protein [Hyphomicrobium sp.]|nr:L,D-transpeptidase family protein [Hyphomicrobium sp.]